MTKIFSASRPIVWTVWMIASIFYAYQYILRVMPNIMLEDIMQQFNINAATFGQFSGVYYIGYSLMHLPIGMMLDRYGPRKIMSLCILLNVVGLVPLIFASHWIYPVAGRFLIGLGSSAAILGVFKIIRMLFNEKNFSRMLSFSVTIGLLGAIYGGGPVSYLREVLGYQAVVQVFAGGGILLALITYFIIPETKNSPEETVLADIREVLSNRKVLFTCIFAGLMVGPLEGFADVWGTVFLKQVYGFEGALAASLPSLIFIGMCFGAPVLSYIADKVGSDLTTITFAAILMALCFFGLLALQLHSTVLSVGFVMVGVCCAYQILAIYKASTYVSERVVGLTTAVANMVIMIFGYVFHAMIGGIINLLGGPSSSYALQAGVIVIPIALSMGAGGFFILQQKDKNNYAYQQK